ncbi:uncharacterized protein LOC110030851 [Phalaenopsis equestris]|uniref:uncharacterized protein LOC110030851 n=1 Tax=Phalaenopsis equestris TaxID=78828 RepID=UPI0009E4EA01|nr:uncharacterized protein LOC110030851 [Phalaenopsis equestris]
MGEGLKKIFNGIYSSCQAEEEEDLGQYSDSGGESDSATSPRSRLRRSPPSRFDSGNPLYDFSYLVEQLPVKKGLSKYYHGKSQSFTSLLEVKALEDLPKKETEVIFTRKMKPCKSYTVLDMAEMPVSLSSESNSTLKKTLPSMASCASSIARSKSGGSRPPVATGLLFL